MELDLLLQHVIDQAISLDIPISKNISPNVIINTRAKTRHGCCKKQNGQYIIEISHRIVSAGEHSCREVLAHEVLHSCTGCADHGQLWKRYAAMMNDSFGYNIQRTVKSETLGAKSDYVVRYRFQCQQCGAVIERMKNSVFVKNYKRYRCRCGGKLRAIDL